MEESYQSGCCELSFSNFKNGARDANDGSIVFPDRGHVTLEIRAFHETIAPRGAVGGLKPCSPEVRRSWETTGPS